MIGNWNRRWRETDSAGCARNWASSRRRALRGLRRRAPQARGAGREDRRRGYLHVRVAAPSGRRSPGSRHCPRSSTSSKPDRHADPQGDRRAAAFPQSMSASITSTSSRSSGTLSGGESQRIRLASQIGSGLSGVLYVLDEPQHRPAPARQCPAPRDPQTPPRPRQHGDRGRA